MGEAAKVCFITASPMTIQAFLLRHIAAAASRWPVNVITNTDDPRWLARQGVPVELIPVGIERKIAPLRDLAALAALWRVFRSRRFALIQSVTPKAGLLSMLGGLLAGVPVRVHTFTGQVWATRTGAARAALKLLDRVTARCATHLLADSPSQRDFLIREGVVPPHRIAVLGKGSLSGVDASRFRADTGLKESVRAELGIDPRAVVFAMVARMNREKGVVELMDAFARVAGAAPEAWLLLVGPDEDGVATRQAAQLGEDVRRRLVLVDFTPAPERFLAASDIYVLPSYREGFPTTVLEAASVGLPTIGTRIYGLSDAVVDGETGVLVPPRDAPALAQAMQQLLRDAALRARLGRAAQERAHRDFEQQRLTGELIAFYAKILP